MSSPPTLAPLTSVLSIVIGFSNNNDLILAARPKLTYYYTWSGNPSATEKAESKTQMETLENALREKIKVDTKECKLTTKKFWSSQKGLGSFRTKARNAEREELMKKWKGEVESAIVGMYSRDSSLAGSGNVGWEVSTVKEFEALRSRIVPGSRFKFERLGEDGEVGVSGETMSGWFGRARTLVLEPVEGTVPDGPPPGYV